MPIAMAHAIQQGSTTSNLRSHEDPQTYEWIARLNIGGTWTTVDTISGGNASFSRSGSVLTFNPPSLIEYENTTASNQSITSFRLQVAATGANAWAGQDVIPPTAISVTLLPDQILRLTEITVEVQ